MKDLRIVFMGTPDFAVGVLRKLVEAKYSIVGVITAPDKPAGRGRKVSQSAVKEYALSIGQPILQPVNLKDEDFLTELKNLQANLQIVVAFRMLPKQVWAMPEFGTFNLHASLLPQYRGAAPINWAIINGEKTTGVTTFFIDEKIDTGEIIDAMEVTIEANETAGSLHDKLMAIGADLVNKTVKSIAEGNVVTKPQPKDINFKEAPKLTPENTKIDWNMSGKIIDQFIRGLNPYPVAWTNLKHDGEELKTKIYSSRFEPQSHDDPIGSITTSKTDIRVAVSDGFHFIEELQLPGKKRMASKDLLNGFIFSDSSKFV